MVLDQRPRPSIIEYNHRVVPEPVARRFVDVQRAINAGLWEQAITTARTAVQVMARLERVDRGTLQQEIERLVDARGDQLASIIRSLAHRIRDAGNDAVHPDDPDWSPTKEEAHEAFVFLQALIEWLYALPARLAVAEQAETEATQQDAEPETAV